MDPRNLVVVPTSLQEEVLQSNHDVKDSGHVGQVNTFLRVKGAFYWFRMRSDVYNYVKTCVKCNTNKRPSRRPRAEMGQYHAGAPMDHVMIDMLGPRGAEFVRPVGRAPLRDCSNTGFQVVRRRRDGAPSPRPASAGRETGSRVSGASSSSSGVPRSQSHSRENVRPRASGAAATGRSAEEARQVG